MAYVHRSDGLLDAVNERLLRRRVRSPLELDTVTLYQQPQGLYSLRWFVEVCGGTCATLAHSRAPLTNHAETHDALLVWLVWQVWDVRHLHSRWMPQSFSFVRRVADAPPAVADDVADDVAGDVAGAVPDAVPDAAASANISSTRAATTPSAPQQRHPLSGELLDPLPRRGSHLVYSWPFGWLGNGSVCKLWREWRACLACENSSLASACLRSG